MVLNDTTRAVRGVHSTKGEAEVQAKNLQKMHDDGIKHASVRIADEDNLEDDGE